MDAFMKLGERLVLAASPAAAGAAERAAVPVESATGLAWQQPPPREVAVVGTVYGSTVYEEALGGKRQRPIDIFGTTPPPLLLLSCAGGRSRPINYDEALGRAQDAGARPELSYHPNGEPANCAGGAT